jgi:hypothetical protein
MRSAAGESLRGGELFAWSETAGTGFVMIWFRGSDQ